ncbi:uncharacterized protein ColSpa_01690 [Colletotrichum spaethianum]|uniref:Uncharacterized protein n=1 Tax=Colletotrichum spaethianum TaxID=700344 RepID=A0AA37P713_9PEZI|nr:uncharacterized protein ColSpa_01690 [Colletotrichum spaethianum]GKT41509.1 hypothetical protein ColSpa_01690 [Colletotrichum spaethianum]
MRLSTLATTAVVALAPYAIEAKFEQIGVPKVIKPGEPFTAQVRVLAAQPSHDYMYWGVRKFDYEWNSFPSPGTVGGKFQKTDLNAVLSGGYYDSIPGLVVPEGTEPGEYALQGAMLGWYGAGVVPALETWWWNVTIGDATSAELVWVSDRAENSRSCVPY